MNVLVEIGHPAHVHFFRHAIEELKRRGHKVHVVSRDKDITHQLLGRYGLSYTALSVAQRGGLRLLAELVSRWFKLARFIHTHKIDVAVSISGITTALPARLCGIKNIIFQDTEDATLSNRIAYPFADAIYTPQYYLHEVGPKHHRYRGLHELAYLGDFDFESAARTRERLGLPARYCVLRVVAHRALHDSDVCGLSERQLTQTVEWLSKIGEVLLSYEGECPEPFRRYLIRTPLEAIHAVLAGAQLFVGESPTMAVEASLLGTPAILVSGRCDRLGNMVGLEKEGLLRNFLNWNAVPKELGFFAQLAATKPQWSARAAVFRSSAENVTRLILSALEKGVARTERGPERDLMHCLRRLEAHCRTRDYAGYSKFDALNSPFLEALFGHTFLTRLLTLQIVNRVPLPLRRIFGVRKGRNPKGIANFVKGYCGLYQMTGDGACLSKAEELAQWLLENHSAVKGQYHGSGLCWGYNFPWQSPGFYSPRHSPNCIVTLFCAEAMLALYEASREQKWLEAARGAKRYLLEDLPVLEETAHRKCIGYVAGKLAWKVVNINAVTAGFLAKLARVTSDTGLMNEAKKMIDWVVSVRTAENTWNYTEPKSQSGIGPDNYHTGGILDGIYDYMKVSGDRSYEKIFLEALQVYRDRFFLSDGAPRWRLNRDYPQDIHGAAQGIITFTKAVDIDPNYLNEAQTIAHWAVCHMQDPVEGYFYYQKFPFFTWKLELMRWNNSWMFWAISELLLRRQRAAGEHRLAG